jgi:hypothetical protein
MATQNICTSAFDQFCVQRISYICSGFVQEFGISDGINGSEVTLTAKELVFLYTGLQYLKSAAEFAASAGRQPTNRDVFNALDEIESRPLVTDDGRAIEALQKRLESVIKFEDLQACTLLFLPIDAAIIVQVGRFWESFSAIQGKANEPGHDACLSLCEKLSDSSFEGIETDLEDYSFVQRLILASGQVDKVKLIRH